MVLAMSPSEAVATSVTEAIAEFACGDAFANAPDALYERATRAFVDTIGVAIAGRNESSFEILARVSENGGDAATVLPTRERASAAQAALLNGTAGHALDYDDVADEITGHPSVVLVSSLLALAEKHGSRGRDLLEAFAVGFQVSCAIARGLPVDDHYRLGWHSTATVGVLGATAGAGRLLRLDQPTLQHALGIAATMASGSRQNFGTMTKPLHAGLAARDAVLATELAAGGFTADPHQLEGPNGYFRLYGVDAQPGLALDVLEEPSVLLAHGLNVKKYPCCYGTHRMADAALKLFENGLRAADVRAIDVEVGPDGLQAIIHHRPSTGLQGKFSGEYVVAACLLDGAVRLSSFADAAVVRPEAQDLLRRVTIREAPMPAQDFATLDIKLNDGRGLQTRCDVPKGDARAPLSDAELEAKFRDCLVYADSTWPADTLLNTLRGLRDAPNLKDLFALP